ncbi:MAG TPA: hypothetical protein VIV60_34835 [Polyangiaceae bacterium]
MSVKLFFGGPGSGYWMDPHPSDLHNVAIQPPTDTLQQGVRYNINITLRNAGEDSVSDAVVRLYWADPSTSYLLTTCNLIREFTPRTVPAHSDGNDGTIAIPVVLTAPFSPSSCVLGTSGGAVAFIARVYSVNALAFPHQTGFDTDPLTAVHSVQVVNTVVSPVVAPAARAMAVAPGIDSIDRSATHFAFAATNPTKETLRTEVLAHDLGKPDRHGDLKSLLSSERVRAIAPGSSIESVEVERSDIHLHLGIESVVARYSDTGRPGIDEFVLQGSRMGHVGPVANDVLPNILFRSREETPSNFELRPFESRQIVLGVVPKGRPGDVNTIEIVHRTVGDHKVLGRMIVVFVVGEGFKG